MFLSLFKKVKLPGYTLLEMMTVIGIFAIMGAFMFTGMPDIAKYIRFQKDGLLVADTVRDLQVRGGSAYSTTTLIEIDDQTAAEDLIASIESDPTRRDNYIVVKENTSSVQGYGMYLDLWASSATNSFLIFNDITDADVESENKTKFGLLSSNVNYDIGEALKTEKLEYSFLDKIFIKKPDCNENDTSSDCNKYEFKKAVVVFLRSEVAPSIKYFDVEDLFTPWKVAQSLYIQLYSPSMPESESYKCIAVLESGQTFTTNLKCDI
jgi:prepilin-type N-terminal cleavage/methylation domain-containing protein